ncbi:MAG: PAS domain S-box protein, partial [Desulfobacterales bacterium]|nr:PAS domain S-box protein [Desulfobacterales bacterium]
MELCAKARRERALPRVEALLEERTRQLREGERRYAAVLDAAGVGVVAADRGGLITLLNPGAERLIGCTAKEAVGAPISRFFPGDLHSEQARLIRRALEEGVVRGFETECLASDGRRVPVEITLNPLTDDYTREFDKHFEVTTFRPAPNQFACIFTDITGRKREEERREKLQARLVQAQKMESVGRSAGGGAHDFNNMLTVILGQAEIALARVDPAHTLCAGLGEIRDAAERSKNLTRQLLAFARKQTIPDFESTRMIDRQRVEQYARLDRSRPGRRNLFAFPAQSNFSGVQHPLEWIEAARARGWDVLVDAAAFAPTNR